MKCTATSCMLVATLIAIVIFAAAYTVLGGVDNGTGAPIFIRDQWFFIFVISDAAALFSSLASIIMFFSILTSCYAENDFLISLPTRLMFGLYQSSTDQQGRKQINKDEKKQRKEESS